MPLSNNTVTPTQYDYLQNNISMQSLQLGVSVDLAQSGLQYVVSLQSVTPEVDLVSPFATHFLNLEQINTTSYYTSVVGALNSHVVTRGTVAQPAEGLSARLNRWLWCNSLKVTRQYSVLSSGAGWIIDECNIETPNSCDATSDYYGSPYPGCPPTAGDPIPNP